MAQREQVLDRAQRLQQAFVNGTLRKQARRRLGLYSRSIGLFKRRSYRNSPNVTVLMYCHLPVASAGKSPWPKCSSTSKRGAGIDRGPRFVSLDEFKKVSIAACPHSRHGISIRIRPKHRSFFGSEKTCIQRGQFYFSFACSADPLQRSWRKRARCASSG
jgi:hypothetical protein